MKIKEFEALTLKDCLHQVRQELGPEAVILETQKFRKGGLLGWGAKDAVRIIAATGISVNDPRGAGAKPAARQAVKEPERQPVAAGHVEAAPPRAEAPARVAATPRAMAEPFGRADHSLPEPDPEALEKLARLEKEMRDIRSGMDFIRQAVVSAPAPSPVPASAPLTPYPALLERLHRADVSEEMALDLLRSLPDFGGWNGPARDSMAEAALREAMAGRVQGGGPILVTPGKTKIVAFVGPTGVGKTTTIAKLAAHFALIEKRNVGLVTMDTYRIAAVDQLKTYSQIIDIPVQVVYNQAEIGPALRAFEGKDLVLVDTAGRSQKNIMQVSELKTMVEMAGCETHLVLSASTKERDLFDQVNRFTAVGIDRLLFTKLDETTTYGTLYTVAAKRQIPISYITTGQKVPEDIEAADGVKLASIVMDSSIGR